MSGMTRPRLPDLRRRRSGSLDGYGLPHEGLPTLLRFSGLAGSVPCSSVKPEELPDLLVRVRSSTRLGHLWLLSRTSAGAPRASRQNPNIQRAPCWLGPSEWVSLGTR